MEVPLEGGGVMVVEVAKTNVPGELVLASGGPGSVTARAQRTLQESLAHVLPVVRAVRDGLVAVAPHETTVEFGLTVGGETGLVFAKGTAEVNFKVTMTWHLAEVPSANGSPAGAGTSGANASAGGTGNAGA
ncbi:CU044_2847 family protein [Frankia nepalensis]|uniref:Trypsin-co-occurring domain-containing protein n=2 Tax=Frankia nepalensis TaxID=1836974 RepID=A0A937RF03_9ACTN|nr:CU044_2847 family protein [Frankia nepalensis]MBL7501936.1 hypothetical protein [Frankia nepalensis]MBL7515201.1 hypothetical protein [Frankia nepalensis]MBL7628812.1 hypothetical protein [Frankia nepalensis]